MIELWGATLEAYIASVSSKQYRDFKKKVTSGWFSQHAEALDILVFTKEDHVPAVVDRQSTYKTIWADWLAIRDPNMKLTRLWRSGWLTDYEKDIHQYVVQRQSSQTPNSPIDQTTDQADDLGIGSARKKSSNRVSPSKNV